MTIEAEAQVAHDLHDALGVKWGCDPYAEINRLKSVEKLCNELLAQRPSPPESPAKEQPGDRELADAKRLEFYWLDQAKISYERVAELEKLLQELLSFPSADPARNKPAGYGKGKLISIMTKNQFLDRVKTTLHLEPSSCAGILSDGTIHQGIKEQPGEQNAELILALRVIQAGEEPYNNMPAEVRKTCGQAAAMIEKLGQGWIPARPG